MTLHQSTSQSKQYHYRPVHHPGTQFSDGPRHERHGKNKSRRCLVISIIDHKVLDQQTDGRQTTGKITEVLQNKKCVANTFYRDWSIRKSLHSILSSFWSNVYIVILGKIKLSSNFNIKYLWVMWMASKRGKNLEFPSEAQQIVCRLGEDRQPRKQLFHNLYLSPNITSKTVKAE